MRKNIARMMILIIALLLLSNFAYADKPADSIREIFLLPSSLLVVEDEAFADTAVKTVVFQDGLIHIGNFVFDNSRELRDIFIPSSVRKIGRSVFPQTRNLVLHAPEKSYAQAWAKKHRFSCRTDDLWSFRDNVRIALRIRENASSLYRYITVPKEIHISTRRTEVTARSMRPQDRPELNPIDYRFP